MAMRSDEDVIDMLVKLAGSAPKVGRASIAACIMDRSQVVSWGFNQKKSHPFQARFGRNDEAIYLHAETDAIKNAIKHLGTEDLSRCTLFVGRSKRVSPFTKKQIYGLAKPCYGCAKAIATFNIKRTVWSVEEAGFSCTDCH